MRLPPAVRAAALAAVGGSRLQKEFAWMSWAGTVWRLEGQDGAVYVKRAGDLKGERDRTVWLAGRLPVPEVLGLFRGFGDDWLLTRAARGVPLSDRSLDWEPRLVAQRMGEILHDIHSVDATGCPFGVRKPGHVLIHGDYCLPNVLVEDGTVPLGDVDSLSDDELIARLVQVRGIGPWTAQMFLMFQLRRLDVWPVDDYGVRKGWATAHGLKEPLKPREMQAEGERFRPYRSIAAWYCWRVVDTVLPGKLESKRVAPKNPKPKPARTPLAPNVRNSKPDRAPLAPRARKRS